MRKITSVLWGLLLGTWFSVSVTAQGVVDGKPMKVSSEELVVSNQFVPLKNVSLKSLQSKTLERKVESSLKVSSAHLSSVNSIDDLVGDAVMSFSSLVSTLGGGGGGVTISKVDNETILIQDFWQKGVSIKAKINLSAMEITIASQKAYTNKDYGDCNICVTKSDGWPDRDALIEGTISSTGLITINSWWGIYVNTGANADRFVGVYEGTEIEKSNGTMTNVTTDNKKATYNVVINQKGTNLVTVRNFANYGKTIELVLKGDSTFTIASQLAWEGGEQYGNFYTYSVNWTDSTMTQVINGKGTDKSLAFGGWRIQSNKNYYAGNMAQGIINSSIVIQYPTLSVSKFEGEGTLQSPYLIRTLDELRLLAEKVNTDKELIYGTVVKHTKTYKGKYFRVENDIDVSSMRLEPIGYSWAQRFAGTFDGNGKKITGLNISTEGNGYAGLFGSIDTVGVVKNITVENATVKSAGYYAGIIAGRCLGTLENCHATGIMENAGVNTGGIAGEAIDVKKASFSGNVIGLGGTVGGIAGQIDGAVSDAWVSATIIIGGMAATYTGGGIAGTLYKPGSSATNCYFVGTLDGSRFTEGLYLGGIIGQCYGGNISKCFNVGTVMGVGSESAVGGVVGKAAGSVIDCYNSGRVYSPASRSAAGIVGKVDDVRDAITGAVLSHTIIRNCYTNGSLRAETYQYNPETETRETIGSIISGAEPVIENIYFDKQMVDLTSKKYGVLTKDLTSASGPAGFSSSVWVFTEGYYPRLKGLEDNRVAHLGASVLQMDAAVPDNVYKVTKDIVLKMMGNTKAYFYMNGRLVAEGHCGIIEGNSIVKWKSGVVGNDTIFLKNGDDTKYYTMTVTPSGTFSGEGTEVNPFLIKTKKDLINLSFITGPTVKQYYKDTYFKMANDIDLEYDKEFKGLCTDASDAHSQFAGHFDGAGYAIHRMELTDGVGWELRPEDDPEGLGDPDTDLCTNYQGFIGRLSPEGSVKNLTIAADCKLVYWGYSAAVVGYNYGLIENCRNYANVTSHSANAGGICGQSQKGSIIRGCYNSGTIKTGYMTAGGIAGGAYGTVENCQNDGSVSAERLSRFMDLDERFKAKSVGGIVGSASGAIIKNVVNTGTLSAYTTVGGIAGSFYKSSGDGRNDMSNAVNYGTILADYALLRGAICGDGTTDGVLSDNYYDNQLLSYGGANNGDRTGFTGVETSVLTSGTLKNFSTDLWELAEGSYPVLKAFASEKASMSASKIILKVAKGENTGDLLSDVVLSAPEGTGWSLKQGKVFTLSGTILKVPESVSSMAFDTLVASIGGYVKQIPLMRIPAVPLTGKGTVAEPYLIRTATEWNAIADYITQSTKSFKGSYLKVSDNISFEGMNFIPIAGDGVNSFEGILDGNKKTITNINFTDSKGIGYLGLFGRIGPNATVADLTIGNGAFSSAVAYIGSFAGKLAGTLKNCINKASVSTTKNYAGGLVALIEGTGKIIDCANYGNVTGNTGNVGGIASSAASGVEFTKCGNEGKLVSTGSNVGGLVATATAPIVFTDCYNKGELSVPKSSAVAGLVANASGSAPFTFMNCYNAADISASSFAGGIIASLNAACPLIVDNCYNTGDIMTADSKSSTGTAGIAAYVTIGSTITNSYNTGNIMSDKSAYAGGITGNSASATEAMPVLIKKCYNTGNIVASGNYGGGITGYMPNYVTIDSCYNIGNIEGSFMLGGISSNMNGVKSIITNSWNSGDVTGTRYAVGGLVGSNSYASTVTNCFNTGNISSTATESKLSYGIGGLAGQGASTYTNCYNLGKISGLVQVGGLVGCPYNGVKNATTGVITYGTSFINCYNAGEVARLDTLVGNFVGETNKRWQYNLAENLYALNEYGTFATDTIGKVINRTELAKLDLGKGWIKGDDYSYPIIEGFCDNDCAKVGAATVILGEGDTFDMVTKEFHIGTPSKLVWETTSSMLTINGNLVTIKAGANEEATLIAKIGDFNKSVTLKLKTEGVGQEDVVAGKVVVQEDFYTVSGIKIAKNQLSDDTVYVVVRTFDDGTTETVKELH